MVFDLLEILNIHNQFLDKNSFPQERTFYFFPAPKVIFKLSALKMFFCAK